jgi:fatty acid synthase
MDIPAILAMLMQFKYCRIAIPFVMQTIYILQVGDLAELKAISLAFSKYRKTPLLIGSVKSNLGHAEAASGLCGIIKVIIGMETGFIPPNLHYSNPREGVESLVNGQLKVTIHTTAE